MHKWVRLEDASRNRALFRTFLFLFTIPVCRAIADDGAPASQSISLSTTTAFPSTTTPSSSIAGTSSSTSAPQSSSSNIGVIVGCTLGGLAVIGLVLLFLVHRWRRIPQVRYKKAEGILDIDIDVPPRQLPYGNFQTHRHGLSAPSLSEYTLSPPPSSYTPSSIPDSAPEKSKVARLREARQAEIDERIQSAQRELNNLLSGTRSAGEIVSPSTAGPSQSVSELASLRNEVQQLRDQVEYLHTQRESEMALGLSNELLPPAYT